MQFALITGASSGIGKSYAEYLGRRNAYALILVARRVDRLEAVKREIDEVRASRFGSLALPVRLLVADLSDPALIAKMTADLKREGVNPSMLVNCAGFATVGAFAQADIDAEVRMLELNCIVPMRLNRAFLPGMLSTNEGTIINVSSIGAFQPAPYMAVYAASKSFVLNYSLALQTELKDSKIRVFTHCPGPTTTEFHLVAGLPEDMSPMPPMTADESVSEAMVALEKGKDYLVNGLINRVMVVLGRFLSPSATAKMSEKVLLSRWTPPKKDDANQARQK